MKDKFLLNDLILDAENIYLYNENEKSNYATPKPVAVPPIRNSSKNRVEINRTKQMKIIDMNKKDNFVLNKINECPSKESSPAQLDNKTDNFAFNKTDENIRKSVEENIKIFNENTKKQSSPVGVVQKIEEISFRRSSPIPVHKKEKINLSNFEEIFMRDASTVTQKPSTVTKSTSPSSTSTKPSPTTKKPSSPSPSSTTTQKSSSTTAASSKTEQFVKNIIEGNMKNMTEKIQRESSPIAMNLKANQPNENGTNKITEIIRKEIIEKEQVIEKKEIITKKMDSICLNKLDYVPAERIVEQSAKPIVKVFARCFN